VNEHDEILCHCDQTDGLPQEGHPLGTPGCSSEIKRALRTSAVCSRCHDYGPFPCSCHGSARGTCPECGKKARVVKVTMRNADGKQIFGVAALGMAPHKMAGRECPGTGRVPTETTYTQGRALTEYLREHPEGVAA
jgi:hypothetical protein